MSLAMVLKIFSDCCVCFALLGSGPVQFEVPLLIPALLYGVVAGLATFAEEKGWTALRWLCGLLPFGCLWLGSGTGQVLVLAVPAAYTALVIFRNKLELEYYAYRRFFKQSLMLLGGAYLLVNVWLFLLQITNDTAPALDPSVIMRYGLVHLLCGIVLQRQLRLGVGNRAAGGKQQMATMLGVAGAIVVGFVLAEPLLRKGIGTLLRSAFSLLIMPLVFLVEAVVNFIGSLKSTQEDKESWDAFMEHLQNEGLAWGNGAGQGQPRPPAEGWMDLNQLWVLLMVVILLIAGVLVLRTFRKRRNSAETGVVLTRVMATPKKKKTSVLSNRGRVRQTYREFLRMEKNLGMKLRISDTSGDVLERIHKDTDRDCASDLRNVYLQARYDDRQTITRSQVEQAKRALKAARMKQ